MFMVPTYEKSSTFETQFSRLTEPVNMTMADTTKSKFRDATLKASKADIKAGRSTIFKSDIVLLFGQERAEGFIEHVKPHRRPFHLPVDDVKHRHRRVFISVPIRPIRVIRVP